MTHLCLNRRFWVPVFWQPVIKRLYDDAQHDNVVCTPKRLTTRPTNSVELPVRYFMMANMAPMTVRPIISTWGQISLKSLLSCRSFGVTTNVSFLPDRTLNTALISSQNMARLYCSPRHTGMPLATTRKRILFKMKNGMNRAKNPRTRTLQVRCQ